MNKAIFFEGLVLIVFAYYVITHKYIYDSLIGAHINIEHTQYPLSIGLLIFGCMLIISSFRKNDTRNK